MKIGDEVYVHGFIDEIRNDVIIIRNDGGYFGTVPSEVIDQEPTAEYSSDVISRQAAIDALYDKGLSMTAWGELLAMKWSDIQKCIEQLPSAGRPKGHWIRKQEKHQTAVCSNCEKVAIQELWGTTLRYYDFCPNCGARMESDEQ